MSERRTGRALPPRSDKQILDHPEDVNLLRAISSGQVVVTAENRIQLKRLSREDLCLAGFGTGVAVTLLARGHHILAAARGEVPTPLDY